VGEVPEKPSKRRFKIFSRRGAIRLVILFALLAFVAFWTSSCMIRMPGSSWKGPLPELSPEGEALAGDLRRDVERLAGEFMDRNWTDMEVYRKAADFIEGRFREAGLPVERATYQTETQTYENIVAEIPGPPGKILVVGAHYDSLPGSPAANDNGSGVAALLALAPRLAGSNPKHTIRLVAFANEEPPWFQGPGMGSRVYAARCKEAGETILGMVSLETIGCYTDEEKSQHYPPPLSYLYPSTGNFIAFVGNISSRALVHRCIGTFREKASFPSEGAALPGWMEGVGWSDHWSFWQEGYPALMVTDTAPFRYEHYHTSQDTPDRLDYPRFARVVMGLEAVIRDLAEAEK
jgi:hypothetical protein